ncbi:MAG: 2-dehydropantoate 2-reductase [Vicinamibacterales bacterium]
MRVLILGAGGVGGYFGGRIAEAGTDVTFLVRPKRREQLLRDGLRISSPVGDAQLTVKTTTSSDVRADYDVVFLACKAYDLESAIDAVAPAIGEGTKLLPLLNGMAHFDRLDARFGRAAVLGGTCTLQVSLGDDGVIRHSGPFQRIVFGERDSSQGPVAASLSAAFGASKAGWEHATDIDQELWEKIVFLSAMAATTCLFRANMVEIASTSAGRDALERAVDANVAVAVKEGRTPRPEAMTMMQSVFTGQSGPLTSSMLRDLERGRAVESDHIVGWMLDRARANGVDDAVLSLAYVHLKAYEARRAAGRLGPS